MLGPEVALEADDVPALGRYELGRGRIEGVERAPIDERSLRAGLVGRSARPVVEIERRRGREHGIVARLGRGDRAVDAAPRHHRRVGRRSEEHTSELQSLMRISYAVFCLKKKKKINKSS